MKTAEQILNKYFPDPDDLVDDRIRGVIVKAMEEYANDRWISVKIDKPTEYGKYLIHRAGCKKTHFETWNGTGWAYNHNDITHWQPIPDNPKEV